MSRVSAKRPMNLSLDADLVDKARAYGVNVSAVAEEALRARIVREEAQAWLDENRDAIAAQNAWTAERGLFSDEFRNW
jgi:antitoxin CcdA